jgi:GNAT superfamily N-acetyltransferase
MEVVAHTDPQEYWALARPLYAADPARHTLALTVGRRMVLAPDPDDPEPTLLTIWNDQQVAGAAFRTPPYGLSTSAIPAQANEIVVARLLAIDPDLPGVVGPRDTAEPFAKHWAQRTDTTVVEERAGRLYRLATLDRPVVPGRARLAGMDDVPLVAKWWREFQVEVGGPVLDDPDRSESFIQRSLKVGNGLTLWEVDGQPASFASAALPLEGMSRIGPVFTPPAFRGKGYGSAVTAAASQWALDGGAENVLLFTDLANPTSNSIYQRIGYRPVHDTTELAFHK